MKTIEVIGIIREIKRDVYRGFVRISIEAKDAVGMLTRGDIGSPPASGMSPYMTAIMPEADAQALVYGAPCKLTLELL